MPRLFRALRCNSDICWPCRISLLLYDTVNGFHKAHTHLGNLFVTRLQKRRTNNYNILRGLVGLYVFKSSAQEVGSFVSVALACPKVQWSRPFWILNRRIQDDLHISVCNNHYRFKTIQFGWIFLAKEFSNIKCNMEKWLTMLSILVQQSQCACSKYDYFKEANKLMECIFCVSLLPALHSSRDLDAKE